MRLPYITPPLANAADQAVANRIAARRHPRPLQPLDRTLLHTPPVADGWNAFLGAIRTKTTSLPADLRELAVSRVAALNGAWYEWGHHAPLAAAAGVSETGLQTVLQSPPAEAGAAAAAADATGAADSDDKSGLTSVQRAVLAYTDEMTRRVAVEDATFARVRSALGDDDRAVVELTAVIASYNCVSRFLVALDIGERNGVPPDGVQSTPHA